MKNKKLFLKITPLIALLTFSVFFGIPYTVASFIEYFTVDTTKPSFIDSATENFICYPLEDSNNNNYCAIGWAKTIEESTGSLTIPQTVTKGTGNEAITYQVKAIAECGFRFCEFSSISFAGNNVEEIKAEAFYSCQNITTFTMPQKCIHGVGPSSFMDCRNLETINMSNVESYIETRKSETDFFLNNPYIIGDHAFTSCIKLKKFVFPINLQEIGDSAFMNCKEISSLYLPVDNGVNEITIRKYAFSDCAKFTLLYFEGNVTNIERYAFAQCDKLRIYYNGDAEALDSAFEGGTIYRKKHVATNMDNAINDYVPIRETQSQITMDDDHLGFVYFKQRVAIKYNGTANGVSSKVLESPNTDYITIFRWENPGEDTNDYNNTTKVLTIPEEIDGCKVKVISEQAFVNDPDLEGIIFNSELVQICRQAFKGCSKLATIDFSACTHLKEIGHEAFNPNGQNNAFTGTINIPQCVWYIGNSAFENFRKATGLTFNENYTQLKSIGNYAFKYLGYSAPAQYKGTLDLVIPKSMSDGAVYEITPEGSFEKQNWCIGIEAFAYCHLIKYVTMQDLGGVNPATGKAWNNKDNPRIGFGRYCFRDCVNLLRFKATKKMMRLGAAMFMNCSKIKEIFLSRYLYNKEDDIFIWSTYDNNANGGGESQSIFYYVGGGGTADGGCEFRDVVIYVDGEDAPVRRSRQQKYYVWNSDARTYDNEYLKSSDDQTFAPTTDGNTRREYKIGRLIAPTYFNVDYETTGTIKYVNLTTGALSDTPTSDYSNIATLLKKNNKYIVTKCYGSGFATIDMTTWQVGGTTIDTIGSCAFASLTEVNNTDPFPSEKIILPAGVTTIRDRAFYSVKNDGINIVTYKNNGVEVTDTGANPKTNICFLPSTVTRVEELAFYNNDFGKVNIPSSLTTLGNSAFLVSSTDTLSIDEFDGSASPYSFINNAMYDNTTRTLLYSAAGINNSLDLSATQVNNDTIAAIGARALANTSYTSVNLPGTVTTLYGGAFSNNRNLTSVTGLSGLKYIAAAPISGEDVWNSSTNYSIYDLAPKDFSSIYEASETVISSSLGSVYSGNMANRPYFYRWLDNFGAFANCTSLTTLNLAASYQTLRKIGYGAFEGCTSLSTMTDGTTTYTYYHYSDFEGDIFYDDYQTTLASAPSNKVDTRTTGVVDLSQSTLLTSLSKDAFRNCSNLKYFHLPLLHTQDTNNTLNGQAKFYLGIDKDDLGSWYCSGPKIGQNTSIFYGTKAINGSGGAVLLGETAEYISSGSGNKKPSNSALKIDASYNLWDNVSYEGTRYPAQYLTNTNYCYYVRSRTNFKADTLIGKEDSDNYKYWIHLGNESDHVYLLFDKANGGNRADLQAFFRNPS